VRPVDRMTLRRAGGVHLAVAAAYAGQRTQAFIDAMIRSGAGFELMARLGSRAGGGRHPRDRDDTRCELRASRATTSRFSRAPRRRRLSRFDFHSVYKAAAGSRRCRPQRSWLRAIVSEIIVVDDGSTDDLQQVISRLAVDVRFLQQDNTGPSAARTAASATRRGRSGVSGRRRLVAGGHPDQPRRRAPGDAGLMGRPRPRADADPGRRVRRIPSRRQPAESFRTSIGAGLYRREAFETGWGSSTCRCGSLG